MRTKTWLVCSLLLGCTSAVDSDVAGSDNGSFSSALRFTPEEVGVLRLLNVPTTNVSLLDIDASLDLRAATNLIARRDGADGRPGTRDDVLYENLAEVDAVSYVGPSAINKLITFAESRGLVPGPNDVLGVFDTVAFSVAEANDTLDLVNEASEATLDNEVGLDPRAVRSILAARPIDTMAQLAGLYYVGPTAMRNLRAFTAASGPSCEGIAPRIAELSAEMWFTSESDYRLDARTFEATPSAANIVEMLGLPAGTLVDDSSTPGRFFEQLGYANEEQDVQALRDYLESELSDLRVLRVGRIQVQVFIVGTNACGSAAGISTVSIET